MHVILIELQRRDAIVWSVRDLTMHHEELLLASPNRRCLSRVGDVQRRRKEPIPARIKNLPVNHQVPPIAPSGSVGYVLAVWTPDQ